jgi:NAD(P)-dependent dehydrogenase (short-subunit alcohol dehydrogenase family)
MTETSNTERRGVVLVTGAGRGIGAACARLAARRGWDVVVNYARDAAAADRVAADVKAAGARVLQVQADVADEAQVLRMFDTLDAKLGRLEGPGQQRRRGRRDRATGRDERGALAPHVRHQRDRQPAVRPRGGAAHEPPPRRQRWSHRQPVSSAASRLGSPGQYLDYAAAKGAIDAFTIGLAKEVAAEGIRVNAVRPGLIETDIHASGGLPDRGGR